MSFKQRAKIIKLVVTFFISSKKYVLGRLKTQEDFKYVRFVLLLQGNSTHFNNVWTTKSI